MIVLSNNLQEMKSCMYMFQRRDRLHLPFPVRRPEPVTSCKYRFRYRLQD